MIALRRVNASSLRMISQTLAVSPPPTLNAGPAGGIEQALRRGDVAAFVEIELGPAFRQAGHRGEVEDHFDALENRVEGVGAKIEFAERKPRAQPRRRQVCLFDVARVI